MNKVKVRGIDVLTAKDQVDLLDYLLSEPQKTGLLVAVNAEKVILADENGALKALIDQADYKYADGISIVKTIERKSAQPISRIAGVDLWQGLMQRAGKQNIKVFLLGSDQATLTQTAEKLRQWNVPIVGIQNGYFSDKETDQIIERIKLSGAKIVTVAMGSPKQELFMQKAKWRYPDALYMGVGGSYDVFVGKVKRAPEIWQKFGLEWLYRLLKQPTRWRRQLRLLKYAYYYATKQL